MVDAGAGMPRGFKIFGAIAVPLVVVLLGVLAFGGAQGGEGGHGMGNHSGDGDHEAGHAGGNHTGRNHNGTREPVTWDVEVRDNSFEPTELTIQVGDTVRWTHVGSSGHTVTSNDDEPFDSHPDCSTLVDGTLGNCMSEGDTYNRTFQDAGDVAYRCKLHEDQGMVANIQVQERYDATPGGRSH